MKAYNLHGLTAGLVVLTVLSFGPLQAQSTTFNNDDANSSWSDNGNWSNTSPVTIGSTAVVFIGTQPFNNQIGVDTGTNPNIISSLTFNNTLTGDMSIIPGFGNEELTVGGATAVPNDGSIINLSAHNISFDLPVIAGDNGIYAGGPTGGSLNFTSSLDLGSFNIATIGVVSMSGTVFDTGSITVGSGTTTGTLTMTGDNTYTGGTVVSGGAAIAGESNIGTASGAFGPSAEAVTLGNANTTTNSLSAAILINAGGITVSNPIIVANDATSGTYTIGGTNTGLTATYTGNITLNQKVSLVAATGGTVDFNTGTWTTNNKAITIGSTGNAGTVELDGTVATTGGITINSGTLLLGATGNLTSSTGVDLANSGTTFDISAGSQTIGDLSGVAGSTVNLGGSGLTAGTSDSTEFDGVIQGTSGGTLTKVGTGTLVITGTNTYGGGTTITAGTLQLGNGGATGSLGSGNIIDDGSLVSDRSGVITPSSIVSGTGTVTQEGPGTLVLNVANTFTGGSTISTGTVTVGISNVGSTSGALGATNGTTGVATLGNANTTTTNSSPTLLISGAFTLSNPITVANDATTGTYTIGGSNTTGTATYTGNIVLNQTVTLQAATGGTVNFTTGTWTTGNNAITVGSTGNTGTVELNHALTTSGGIAVAFGTLALDAALTGSTTVASGATLSGTGSVSGTTGVTGGTINGSGLTLTGATTFSSGANTLLGTETASDGVDITGSATVSQTSGTLTGSVSDTSSGSSTFSGAIAGSSTVTLNNASGTLALNGAASTFTGAVAVDAGTLNFTTGNATATGTQSLGENANLTLGVASTSSGILQYTGTGAATLAKSISALGNGSDTIENSGTGLLTLSGTLTKNGTKLTLDGGSHGITVSGQITGLSAGSDLIVTGGTTTLTNTTNNYNGPTYVQGEGTLVDGTGAGATLPTGTTLYIGGTDNSTGTFDLDGDSQTVAGLNSQGTGGSSNVVTNNGTANSTLTVTGGGTFAGVIQNGSTHTTAFTVSGGTMVLSGVNTYTGATTISSGTLSLTGTLGSGAGGGTAISSAGTLTESGAGVIAGSSSLNVTGGTTTLAGTNTYTGATMITTGTLVLSGTGSAANSAVTVASGAALDAMGTTNSVGAITLDSGGTINLQNSAINTLDGTTLTVPSGTGTISIDVGSSSGQNSDLLSLTSASLAAGSLVVNVDALTDATAGTQYNFLDASGLSATDFSQGTLSGLPALAGDTLSFSVVGDSAYVTINSASGNSYYYNGASGTDFTQADNFSTLPSGGSTPSGAPTASSNVFIATDSPSNIAPTLGANNLTINTLTFLASGSGATLSGTGTLTIDAGVTVSTGATDTETISAPVALGASQTWTVNGTSTLADSGGISGAFALTKAGTGTLALSGANTYSGATLISAGTLALSGTSSLADSSGVDLTASGATFDISAASGNETINDLTGVAGSMVNLGAKGLTAGTANSTTFAGVIEGTGGSFTKAGTGTLTLSGVNTYTGATTINAGTLALSGSGSLVDSSEVDLTASGATFDISAAAGNETINDLIGVAGSTVNLGANGLTAGTANSTTFAGVIQGTGGSFTKAGTGTLTLSGANTYTGATTINAGTLALSGSGSLVDSSEVDLTASGTTFDISAATGNETINDLIGVTGTNVNLGAKGLTAGTANSTTFAGVIEGTSGSFTKAGTGTLTLSGVNTYTGATTINAGTLALSGSGSLVDSSEVDLTASGATFDISAAAGNETINDLIGVAGSTVNLGANGLTAGTANSTTFAGVIQGTGGSFTKAGTGTLTLSGANTYTGATTINAGTLALSGSGSLVDSSEVDLTASGATFDISAAAGNETINDLIGVAGSMVNLGAKGLTAGTANSTTFAGVIEGTGGSFTKAGTGTLTLSGANMYTGNTMVSAGTLQIGNGSTGAISNSSAVSVSSGATLAFDEATGSTQINAITDSGTVAGVEGGGITNTLSGNITGTGAFTQTGTGTTVLSGDNGYIGGTTISAGTLMAGSANALGATTNSLTDNATLDLDGSSVTVGALTGSGTVTNDGGSDSTLTVSGGGDFTGGIEDGSTNTTALTLSAGTLVLSGASGYTGGTTISTGSTLEVESATALGAGAVINNGTLEAGGGQHVINVSTDYTQNAGGTLDITLRSDPVVSGTNDLLSVGGTATLNGNLDIIVVPSGAFTPTKGDSFTVVETTGGITTAGAGFTTNIESSPGLIFTGAVANSNDDLVVTILSTQLALTSIPGVVYTPNQASVANYVSEFITSGPLFNALANVVTNNPQLLPGIQDQLSPGKFGNFAISTVINNAAFSTELLDGYFESQRSRNGDFGASNGQIDSSGLTVVDPSVDPGLAQVSSRLLAWSPAPLPHGLLSDSSDPVIAGIDMGDMKPMTAPDKGYDYDVFVMGNAILAQDFSQADLPHADTTTGAVQIGADYRITPHLRVGAIFGYGHTDADLDDIGSKATVDSYAPGAFISYAQNGWYFNALGSYGFDNFTEDRSVSFPGFAGIAHGAPNGDQIVGNLDGGYDFHVKNWTFGPLAGVQYTHLDVDSYTEGGADPVDLQVGKVDTDSLRSRLGGHVSYAFQTGKVVLTPHLDASWQHEFMDQSQGITSQFTSVGVGSFTINTPQPSRDSALIDGGLSADLNGQVSLYLDYLVQAGQSNYFGQAVQAGVKVGF